MDSQKLKALRNEAAGITRRQKEILDTLDRGAEGDQATALNAEMESADKRYEELRAEIGREEEFREKINKQRLALQGRRHGEFHDWNQAAIESKDLPKFRSLGEMLHAVARAESGPPDPRLTLVAAATGMNESQPSYGGFLVGTDMVSGLLQKTYDTGQIASKIGSRYTASGMANSVRVPRVDETSRANGSRWGGLRAYWSDEAGSATASTWKPALMEMKLHNLRGLLYATDELLQDAPLVESFVNENFPKEFAFVIDDSLVNGTGSGQPLGWLNAGATVSVAKESGQAAATIVFNNVQKMWARMWAASRANSVWFINQDCEPQLNSMTQVVGTGGVPVYLPPGGLSETPYARLMGRPVIPVEHAATLGTVGDISLVDMGQYAMLSKGGIEAASSIHVKFINHETTFRFTMRLDAQPTWAAALTPYKGSNTLSPFVTLATRA